MYLSNIIEKTNKNIGFLRKLGHCGFDNNMKADKVDRETVISNNLLLIWTEIFSYS